MSTSINYQLLAELFRYPSVKLIDNAVACQNEMKKHDSGASQILERFVCFLLGHPMYRIDEVYVKSPHIQLFQQLNLLYEEFKRHNYLSNLVQIPRESVIMDCTGDFVKDISELPGSENKTYIRAITTLFGIPAIRLILDEFETANGTHDAGQSISKRDNVAYDVTEGIYQYAFKALLKAFEKQNYEVFPMEEVPALYNVNKLITARNSQNRQIGFRDFWVCRN